MKSVLPLLWGLGTPFPLGPFPVQPVHAGNEEGQSGSPQPVRRSHVLADLDRSLPALNQALSLSEKTLNSSQMFSVPLSP